jgi:hypothetical protein
MDRNISCDVTDIVVKTKLRDTIFRDIYDFESYMINEYGRSYDIHSKLLQFAD